MRLRVTAYALMIGGAVAAFLAVDRYHQPPASIGAAMVLYATATTVPTNRKSSAVRP